MFPPYQRHLVLQFSFAFQCQHVQYGKDRGDGAPTPRGPGGEAEAPRASGIESLQNVPADVDVCVWW